MAAAVGILTDEASSVSALLARPVALGTAVALTVVALCLRALGRGVEIEFGEQVDDEVVTRVDTAVDEPHFFVTEVVPGLLLAIVHRPGLVDTDLHHAVLQSDLTLEAVIAVENASPYSW